MQKNPDGRLPLPFVCDTCAQLNFHLQLALPSPLQVMTIAISITMNLLLSKPTGLINLPLWTSSLPRSFSLSHAYQRLSEEAAEKKRMRREKYTQMREIYLKDPEGKDEPWRAWYKPSRYKNDPTWRAEELEKERIRYDAELKNNKVFKMQTNIRRWQSHAWVRDELPWKSHRPIVYDQSTEHYCAGCR